MPLEQTFNNARLDDLGRKVWFAAMTEIDKMLAPDAVRNYEKMDTLAHIADAAATGFDPDGEENEE